MLMRKVSRRVVAIGGAASLAAYVAMSTVLDRALDAASSESAGLATYGLLHCTLMLVAIPTSVGFATGRIAGHDRALHGALAALPVSFYALLTLFFGYCACCGAMSVIPAALVIPCCTAIGARFSAGGALVAKSPRRSKPGTDPLPHNRPFSLAF